MVVTQQGRANPNDYVVGRGVLYFGVHNSAGRPTAGYRDLGNATACTMTMTEADLDHMNSRQALKFVDRNVIISEKMEIGFKLDEINQDNMALWMSGSAADVTTHNGLAILTPGNMGNLDPAVSPVGGVWYDVFKTVSTTGGGLSNFDDRMYDLGAVTIAGAVEGTDYIVDYIAGRIFVYFGGALDALTSFTIVIAANASADASYREARALTGAPLRGSLKLIQINPSNQNQLREIQWHKVQVKPTGTINLIGDTWEELEFKGVAEKNSTESLTSPVCSIRTYNRALGSVAD